MEQEHKARRDPEGTRRRILQAATEEFSRCGLGGARVDQIAKRAKTNERMLYYYFGSKEGLFLAVLERVYLGFIEAERQLPLEGLPPVDAIRKLAGFVWTYYFEHPELLRLINSENLHEGRHLKRSAHLDRLITPIIEVLGGILQRGAQEGIFRSGIDPMQFYLVIASLGYFVLSNQYTIEAVTGRSMGQREEYERFVETGQEILLSYLVRR